MPLISCCHIYYRLFVADWRSKFVQIPCNEALSSRVSVSVEEVSTEGVIIKWGHKDRVLTSKKTAVLIRGAGSELTFWVCSKRTGHQHRKKVTVCKTGGKCSRSQISWPFDGEFISSRTLRKYICCASSSFIIMFCNERQKRLLYSTFFVVVFSVNSVSNHLWCHVLVL